MGRSKRKMKMIHSKRVKNAKEKIKKYLKGEIKYSGLSHFARKLLQKGKKR